MDKLVAKAISQPGGSVTRMLFTQSLLGGCKRVIGFFAMTEIELAQAGIVSSRSHNKFTEDDTNLPVEVNAHGRYF